MSRRRPFALLALALGMGAVAASAGVHGQGRVAAAAGCGTLTSLPRSQTCTHGADSGRPGTDMLLGTPPMTPAELALAPDPTCNGDGTSGKRVEVVYAYPAGTSSRYTTYLETFRAIAGQVDLIVKNSAAQTGGTRTVNWVTSSCQLVVHEEQVRAEDAGSFDSMKDTLVARGYDDPNRKYLVFLDENDPKYCGLGEVYPDDRADPAVNLHNGNTSGALYARVNCWDDQSAAHELGHTLGAVQDSAPHSTVNGHCYDEYDVMCYNDDPDNEVPGGPNPYPTPGTYCASEAYKSILDCGHDDYFSTAPTGYLAMYWNTADSDFLGRTLGNAAPVVTASFSPARPREKRTVSFTASATDSNGIASYSWAFGDGSTATGASVQHTYAHGGNYYVKAYATDGLGMIGGTTLHVPVGGSDSDLNGEGRDDLVLLNHNGAGNGLYLSWGTTGGVSTPGIVSGFNYDPAFSDVTVSDVNGDGRDDVLLLNGTGGVNGLKLSWGTVGGVTTPTAIAGFGGFDPAVTDMTAGDLNGDGRDDLALLTRTSAGNVMYLSFGTPGGVQNPEAIGGFGGFDPDTTAIGAGDVNGDGLQDLVLLNHNGAGNALYVAWGTPGGVRTPSAIGGFGGFDPASTELAVGDFNGDGRHDVGLLRNSAGTNSLYLAFGTVGGVQSPSLVSGFGGFNPASTVLSAGDYNGDGRHDLALLYRSSGGVNSLYLSWGTTGGVATPAIVSGSGFAGFDPASTLIGG
jgi:hypothetical protein